MIVIVSSPCLKPSNESNKKQEPWGDVSGLGKDVYAYGGGFLLYFLHDKPKDGLLAKISSLIMVYLDLNVRIVHDQWLVAKGFPSNLN